MDNKVAFFAFTGNFMCFVHVMLNALDMESKGMEAKIIIEGEAVKLVKGLEESGNPLYKKAKEKGIFASICKACSAQMGVLEYNHGVGIPIGDDMSGHPAMEPYIEKGYKIIAL